MINSRFPSPGPPTAIALLQPNFASEPFDVGEKPGCITCKEELVVIRIPRKGGVGRPAHAEGDCPVPPSQLSVIRPLLRGEGVELALPGTGVGRGATLPRV